MASGLTLTAGPLSATASFKGTDAQFQTALSDYLIMQGLDQSGTNQQKLQRVVDDIYQGTLTDLRNYRRAKLAGEQKQALEDQLNTELPT